MSLHKQACQRIVAYEHAHGRKDAKDVSDDKKGYDVASSERHIEVKVTSHDKMYPDVSLEPTTWEKFRGDPKAWLYIVYGFGGKNPKLVMIPRDKIKASQIKIPRPPTVIAFPEGIKKQLKSVPL